AFQWGNGSKFSVVASTGNPQTKARLDVLGFVWDRPFTLLAHRAEFALHSRPGTCHSGLPLYLTTTGRKITSRNNPNCASIDLIRSRPLHGDEEWRVGWVG